MTRSIPARAGKPGGWVAGGVVVAVYPRPCGEAPPSGPHPQMIEGLSPPVRGSRDECHELWVKLGSIPARAGKPTTVGSGSSQTKVYPRPCGEAGARARDDLITTGLSPPVRGSLHELTMGTDRPGSIPARAGKPGRGLSPPVRGSRKEAIAARRSVGSIPARAGKPKVLRMISAGFQVYPRPCGEAASGDPARSPFQGLSPPVRGSLLFLTTLAITFGSIPARAGKPQDMRHVASHPEGLSPPVRGSL